MFSSSWTVESHLPRGVSLFGGCLHLRRTDKCHFCLTVFVRRMETIPSCPLGRSQNHRITQNYRMLGVGRDLWGSSSPTPLPKQGHLEQAAQDLVQAGLEYLQRRRLHNLPGQPVPVLRHPQREEVLPHVQTELPMLQFVPVVPCPVAGHHGKEFGPILLTPTLRRNLLLRRNLKIRRAYRIFSTFKTEILEHLEHHLPT